MYHSLLIHSSIKDILVQLGDIMNKAAGNIHTQVFMWIYIFNLGKYLRVWLVDHIK